MPLVFIDWEFTDFGRVGETCHPLSVGMVSEDGQRALYIEFENKTGAWLKAIKALGN